jgi:hypothetical protein
MSTPGQFSLEFFKLPVDWDYVEKILKWDIKQYAVPIQLH